MNEPIQLTDKEAFVIAANTIKRLNGDITALTTQRDSLAAWKESQLAVEKEWDAQAVGKLLGLPLGSSIRAGIEPAIRALAEQLEEAKKNIVILNDRIESDAQYNGSLMTENTALRSALAEKEKALAEANLNAMSNSDEAAGLAMNLANAKEDAAFWKQSCEQERARLAALEADKRRLDWLEGLALSNVYIRKVQGTAETVTYGWRSDRLRELIDASMAAELHAEQATQLADDKRAVESDQMVSARSALSANPRLLSEGGEGK